MRTGSASGAGGVGGDAVGQREQRGMRRREREAGAP